MAEPANLPEATAGPVRKGLVAPSRPRDPRIDAFRGLALMMILIDHMPGNPWENITVRNIGFSDAAEAFFVMSGIAAGIAYSVGIERWLRGEVRLWDAMAPMWRRAWTLYIVQIVLTVAAIGLFAWAADVFYRAAFREMHNLSAIYDDTGPALIGLPLLGYQIGYVNILPSYIVLLLVTPAVLIAGLRAPGWTFAVALGLWFVAGVMKLNLPLYPNPGGWFLNPLTWQLIFVLGLLIGIRHRRDQRLVPVSWPLFGLALGFLILAFAWRHIPDLGAAMNHKMAQLGTLGAPRNITTHNKTLLALPRLLHILALVYVLSCLPIVTRLCAHPLAGPLRLMGGHGLLVFGLGTLLALAGQILMIVEPDVRWLPVVLPIAGVLICYIAARMADISSSRSRTTAPSRHPARSDRPHVAH